MRAAYRALKDHATARGISFKLSFPYFKRFAIATSYLLRKGLEAGSLTVDRINNQVGYRKGNVQVLTRSQNSIKRAKRDAIRMSAGYKWQENLHATNGKN